MAKTLKVFFSLLLLLCAMAAMPVGTALAQRVVIVQPDTSYAWDLAPGDTLYVQPDTSWTGAFNSYIYDADSVRVSVPPLLDTTYTRAVYGAVLATDPATLSLLQAWEAIRLGEQ